MTDEEEEAFDRRSPFNFHKCKSCTFRTKSLGTILSHNKKHQLESKSIRFSCLSANLEAFECEFCYFEIDLKIALDRHENLLHRGHCPDAKIKLDSYSCDKCDFESYSLLVFARHICDYSRPKHQNLYQIEMSSRKTVSNLNRRKRDFLEYCDQDGVRWFKCDQCSFKTKRKERLKDHILSKHTNPHDIKWFECGKCDHKTKFKRHLRQHILTRHAEMEEAKCFECEKCPYKTKFAHHLRRHVFVRHTTEKKSHTCKHCSFRTKFEDKFEKHMLLHTDPEHVRHFACENCSYKSVFKENLRSHALMAHPSQVKWFECEQCSYESKFKGDLKRHKLCKHASPDEIEWFNCEHCFYKSRLRYYLNLHVGRKHIQKQILRKHQIQ